MPANNTSNNNKSNHQMRIEVRLPNGHWAGDVSRSHPASLLRIDEHMALAKGQGTGIISSTEDISMSIIAHPGVADFDVVESNRSTSLLMQVAEVSLNRY